MNLKNVPSNLVNQRLDKVATVLFQTYSRTQIKKWILEGRLLVNGEISNPKDLVNENDEIEINPIEENKTSWASQKIDFEVHFAPAPQKLHTNFQKIDFSVDFFPKPALPIGVPTLRYNNCC